MGKTVIVVGAGLAGMTAACAAQKEGAEVILLDRGSIGLGTNTALAGAVFCGPTAAYPKEKYIADTLDAGRRINNRPRVELVAEEARGAIAFLRSQGIDLTEFVDTYGLRPPSLHEIPGVILAKEFSRIVKGLPGISVRTGFYVTQIKKEGVRVSGVTGFDRSGHEIDVNGSAVVLATGGAGAIYLNNDNQKDIMGQGYLLSVQAGLQLWDMEFVQFYPIVLAEPRLPSMLVYPPYTKEIRLINPRGDNILAKYGVGDINEAILKKRDEFSEILFREIALNPVYIDFRGVPTSSWENFPLNLLTRLKFDFREKPVRISPATHFFMGGIRVNEKGQTSLPGLFACGEVVWGLHGANRRGGNALTECAVTGRIAGQSAAKHAFSRSGGATPVEIKRKGADQNTPNQREGVLRAIRHRIKEIAWHKAGIVRSEKGIREGLAGVDEIRADLTGASVRDPRDKWLKQDLLAASLVLKAILTASLARKESRGSFIREDFRGEDNVRWLKNSCAAYNKVKDDFSITFHDALHK